MSVTLVADLRAHLNLDHTADDALLAQKLDAAEDFVAATVGNPLYFYGEPLPPILTQAILMLAAYWYETREAAAPGSPYVVPFGFNDLLQPYRAWTV
ncbi:head-tail connector protein [Rhodobacter sp. KR11]|uniref:head-tail connector protein n=1 Tax=Rhodobacter sp. KR11 TaxID=2974588 RepID=UPI0022235C3A|nr:head-tail connector protein [Rhodobacter sp. KR11]MCW1919970.1 head-tail connector protein [Rhodobacter sp. KR11]